MAEDIPLSAIEALVKDDINDALKRANVSRRVADDVSVRTDPTCDCEFCTHPDHQQGNYIVYIDVGHDVMIPMRRLHIDVIRGFESRQRWVDGCVARLLRGWNRGWNR